MLKKFKPFEASVIFEFKDPDTGAVFREKSLTELYKNIVLYRDQNGLEPLEMLREVVENYMCELPINANKCQGVKLNRSIMVYVKGGIALAKNLFFKRQVTQEVAEKRAKQCETCKFNVWPDKTSFMKWADNLAISQVGEKKVSNHDKLASCEVCTCNLRSKVFFGGKLDKFNDKDLVQLKSVKCWQLELSGQDK